MKNKMQLTFDEYDHILNVFKKMNSPAYWPTLEQLDIMKENPGEWLLFACYICEKAKSPKTNTEKYNKKNLIMFVNEFLELVDNEAEVMQKPMMIPDFLRKTSKHSQSAVSESFD